jgi:tape measure domain-containing protein
VSVVANVAINVDSRNAVSKLREVQSQSQQTERAIGGLGSAIGKLAAAFSLIQAAKFVFVSTAEIETQTRSLQVLTGSAEKAGQIIKDLQQLGAVTPFTSSELIDSAKRLQAFGVETNKVVETTRRLADVSGATGAELQGLVTAYGQVQAKGRLQGEELLQFQERGVALQQVLREEYNLSGEEFQDALEKGRISAEAVEYAIQKLTTAGGKYADGAVAQSDTLAGRLSTLQDAVQNLASRLGSILAPAMQSILGLAIDIANQVNNVFETILLQRQLGANLSNQQRDRLFRQAGQEAEQIAKLRGGGRINADQFTQLREERFRDLMRTYGYQQGILKPPTATPPAAAATLPGLMAATGGKGRKGKSDAEKAAEKAAREAEKLRQELERSLEVGDQLGTQFSRQAALLFEGSEIERKRLQIQFDFQDRAKQIAELKNAEQRTNLNQLNAEIQRLEIIQLQTEELKKQAEEAEKLFKQAMEGAEFGVAGQGTVASGLSDAIARLKEDLNPIKLQIDAIVNGANAIGSAFGQAFQDVATGAKSTQEALADAFESIGKAFVSMAAEIIAKQMTLIILQTIFNALSGGGSALGTANKNLTGTGALKTPIPGFAIGGRASGGPVSSNQPYIVGERGPELFVPGVSGSVVSNADTRAALAQQATNRQGNDTRAMLNQQTANRQMNAGGSAMQQKPIEVKYESTVINGVEYVTTEQHQRGIALAAERGRALTLQTLQNSVKTRKRVGMA